MRYKDGDEDIFPIKVSEHEWGFIRGVLAAAHNTQIAVDIRQRQTNEWLHGENYYAVEEKKEGESSAKKESDHG